MSALRNIISALVTLLLVSAIVFYSLALLPGDPALVALGENSTAEQRAIFRAQNGLDQPVFVRYVTWLGDIVTGEFGTSLRTKEPVSDKLLTAIPVTVELALVSVLLAAVVGIALGFSAAACRGSTWDTIAKAISVGTLSVPYFWIGLMFLLIFAVELRVLPPSGFVPLSESVTQNLRHILLPCVTLALPLVGLVARQTGAAVLEVMDSDFVRTARAKGINRKRILVKHVLRNSLIPIISVTSLQLTHFLGGTAVVETIFSLPGLGSMIVDSIFDRDFAPLQGAIIAALVMIVVTNVLTDVAYTLVDRRTRSER